MKTCPRCLAQVPASDFGSGFTCKACVKAYNRRYYELNREKVLAHVKAARASDVERARARERIAAAKQYATRTKKRRAATAKWAAENKGKRLASKRNRDAVKLQATPAWVDRKALQAIYDIAALTGDHVDHIVPLRNPLVCGLHVPWNLQLLPPAENLRKSNRLIQP